MLACAQERRRRRGNWEIPEANHCLCHCQHFWQGGDRRGGSLGNHPERKRMEVSAAKRDCTEKIRRVHAAGRTARTKETFAGGREASGWTKPSWQLFNSQLWHPRGGALRAARCGLQLRMWDLSLAQLALWKRRRKTQQLPRPVGRLRAFLLNRSSGWETFTPTTWSNLPSLLLAQCGKILRHREELVLPGQRWVVAHKLKLLAQKCWSRNHLSPTKLKTFFRTEGLVSSSLFPFIFQWMEGCRAGAHLKGEKKEKGAKVREARGRSHARKEHLQPKALHIHFWLFFSPHSNVLNSLSSFRQPALWICWAFVSVSGIGHDQNKQTNKPQLGHVNAALMTAGFQSQMKAFTDMMQQISTRGFEVIIKPQLYTRSWNVNCSILGYFGQTVGSGSFYICILLM